MEYKLELLKLFPSSKSHHTTITTCVTDVQTQYIVVHVMNAKSKRRNITRLDDHFLNFRNKICI